MILTLQTKFVLERNFVNNRVSVQSIQRRQHEHLNISSGNNKKAFPSKGNRQLATWPGTKGWGGGGMGGHQVNKFELVWDLSHGIRPLGRAE